MPTLIEARDHDFVTACIKVVRSAAANGETLSLDEVVMRARAMPPLSHYVNYDTALRMITRFEKDPEQINAFGDCRREMWRELHQQTINALIMRGFDSLADAVSHVLLFRHPTQYYISQSYGERIFTRYVADRVADELRRHGLRCTKPLYLKY